MDSPWAEYIIFVDLRHGDFADKKIVRVCISEKKLLIAITLCRCLYMKHKDAHLNQIMRNI